MSEITIPKIRLNVTPLNKTVICSMAMGNNHVNYMRWMAPTVEYYAALHQMDTVLLPLFDWKPHNARPSPWSKVILIHHLLQYYKTVIWMDADMIIVNPFINIRSELDSNTPVHVVAYRIEKKIIPSTGLWVSNHSPESFQILNEVWRRTEFVKDGWWEQAAFMDVIGYEPRKRSCIFRGETPYTRNVKFINERWNSRMHVPVTDPIIVHYSGPNKSEDDMRKKYRLFLRRIM
ncbi:MAG: hypothetical protein K0Q81_95 [Paenibacillus sp.]|nr:hypothetical protein [Paenibacillus sp.]